MTRREMLLVRISEHQDDIKYHESRLAVYQAELNSLDEDHERGLARVAEQRAEFRPVREIAEEIIRRAVGDDAAGVAADVDAGEFALALARVWFPDKLKRRHRS